MLKCFGHLALLIAVSTFGKFALGATTEPSTRPVLLAHEGVADPSHYSASDLAKMWPAFQHAPFDGSGFNAISLPFRYRDETGSGDSNEANAFAFLLSNAMDWAPGSYCQRHAYFIFPRSRNLVLPLTSDYDPQAIAGLISSWSATHAIGGMLRKTTNGYKGSVEIYDSTGQQVDSETIVQSESYFDLLGDMAAAAMKYFGEPPSDALTKYLKVPRCKDPKSLARLGSTAYMDRPQQLKLLDDVWKKDRKFGELRSWIATQSAWETGDHQHESKQLAFALGDYLTSEDLRVFDPRNLPGLAADKYAKWWQTAADMVPPDSPLLATHDLNECFYRNNWDPTVLDQAIRSAALYPNNYWMLYATSYIFIEPFLGRLDGDMAASLCLAAMQNKYLTGVGTKSDAVERFANQMTYLGRNDIAAQILLNESEEYDENEFRLLMNSLTDLGQYQKALEVYQKRRPELPNYAGNAALRAILAAAMLGDAPTVESIIAKEGKSLETNDAMVLANAYLDVANHRAVNLTQAHGKGPIHWQYLVLLSQLELAIGHQTNRKELVENQSLYPGTRPGWILLDAYDRQDPQPQMIDFYQTLKWLYPDDAWATHAARDGIARHSSAVAADVDTITTLMKDFSPQPATPQEGHGDVEQIKRVRNSVTPWAAASAIRQLVEKQDYKSARDLALRYSHFCGFDSSIDLCFWASHLAYKVDEIEKAKKR